MNLPWVGALNLIEHPGLIIGVSLRSASLAVYSRRVFYKFQTDILHFEKLL